MSLLSTGQDSNPGSQSCFQDVDLPRWGPTGSNIGDDVLVSKKLHRLSPFAHACRPAFRISSRPKTGSSLLRAVEVQELTACTSLLDRPPELPVPIRLTPRGL